MSCLSPTSLGVALGYGEDTSGTSAAWITGGKRGRSLVGFHVAGQDLASALDVPSDLLGDLDVEHEYRSVAIHSNYANEGSIFFALQGQRDGHHYALRAIENGARLIVCRYVPDETPESLRQRFLIVPDPVATLQALARYWREALSARFIAITGTVGKTTTKDALHYLMEDGGREIYVSPTTYNSHIGVPMAILDCAEHHQFAIIEASIDSPELPEIFARLIQPELVVAPSMRARWMDTFQSHGAMVESVARFINSCPRSPTVLISAHDGDESVELTQVRSWHQLGDRFQVGHETPSGMLLSIHGEDAETALVRTDSRVLAQDVTLACTAASHLLGEAVSVETVLKRVNGYSPTASRFEQWRSPRGVIFMRDQATSNPVALRAALRAAKNAASSAALATGRKPRMLVLLRKTSPDMLASEVEAIAQVLLEEEPQRLLVVDPDLADHLTQLLRGKLRPNQIESFETSHEVRQWIDKKARLGDAILIQSPRSDWMSDLAGDVISNMVPNRMYVDLDALEHNVREMRRIAGPHVKVAAMVKAMAYGTDPRDIAQALERFSLDFLAVSNADEGQHLRDHGIKTNILVMLSNERDIERMVNLNLTPVVYSEELLAAYIAFAESTQKHIPIHLEVDTGMHRTGIMPDRLRNALEKIHLSVLHLEGLMTHLACADEPAKDAITVAQLDRFDALIAEAHALGFDNFMCHTANSAGTIRFPRARHDLVRIGLALLGIHPCPETRPLADLRPVVRLISRIVEASEISPGEIVGYGATFTASHPTRVGVVPAGYHDCIPRNFSNVGSVEVLGRQAPIIGRVSMDSMMIDLSECPEAGVGTDVTIYGGAVPIEEIAEKADTIPYELLTRVSARVQRILLAHGASSRPR